MTAAKTIAMRPTKYFISRYSTSPLARSQMPGLRWKPAYNQGRRNKSFVETPIEGKGAPPADQGPAPSSTSALRLLHSWIRDLFFALLVSFFIILFLSQPVKVEGGSMEPGLEDQERIFINKLVYRWESIGRGDIVVFRYPLDRRKSFIKRAIALPGDRVRISSGHVYVNGRLLEEAYVPEEALETRSYPETTISRTSNIALRDHPTTSITSRPPGPTP